MFCLPRTTHRYLIETISGKQHIIFSLWKRFIKFTTSIAQNRKKVLSNIFQMIKHDCRSITGRDLRSIALAFGIGINENMTYDFSKMKYHQIPDYEYWRTSIVREILDTEQGFMQIEGFLNEELSAIKEFVCSM